MDIASIIKKYPEPLTCNLCVNSGQYPDQDFWMKIQLLISLAAYYCSSNLLRVPD